MEWLGNFIKNIFAKKEGPPTQVAEQPVDEAGNNASYYQSSDDEPLPPPQSNNKGKKPRSR